MSRLEIIRSSEKPKVTIGVCVRNCENTIKDAIECILAQDFPHRLIEVIFVDDGSTDRTPSIILEYMLKMDMSVKLFRHSWRGLGASRNVVVKNAGGDYIIWVDGDMVLPKDHVRKQIAFIEQDPHIGIAKAKYGLLNTKGIIEVLEIVPFAVRSFKSNSSNLPGTGGAIFRTSILRQIGGFDNRLFGVGEDLDIAYRIASSGWLIRTSNAVFFERCEQSLSDLWKKYIWYGYGNFFLYRKNKFIFKLYKMTPLVGLCAGLIFSHEAYKLIQKKVVFLLPLHFFSKLIAWWIGFLSAYANSISFGKKMLR